MGHKPAEASHARILPQPAITLGRMLELLRELVEIESPTYSPGALAVTERMAYELEALGAEVQILDGAHLRAELDGKGEPLLLSFASSSRRTRRWVA